jgi:hypothetical protein
MNNPNFSSTLYDCATECALRRKSKKCKAIFGGIGCTAKNCSFDIRNYVDADPRHLRLFMIQAETRAATIRSSSRRHHPIFALLVAACLLIAWNSYRDEQKLLIQLGLKNEVTNTAPVPRTINEADILGGITYALNQVSKDFERNIDVNADGLTNCIDAAVRFYYHFPYKDYVCILVNRNPNTGMHHLFNGVLINGVWRAIEPQAYYKLHNIYYRRDIWGNQYDHTLNRYVTKDYLRYVK